MITCAECIERMKPDDPRIRSGRYRMCGCDYCNKPTYLRELEEEKPQVIEHIHFTSNLSRKQWDEIQQLKRTVSYLLKEKNKQPIKKKEHYTIK
ncbi:hypothetical protein LCGC14_2613940 [marine sediment metagenome]|uniref:Uncharacterized protein n=1 Tax=marine sediment metagenome TaxID=412755 RepID=A0A0F9CXQ4_9ZZZZ